MPLGKYNIIEEMKSKLLFLLGALASAKKDDKVDPEVDCSIVPTDVFVLACPKTWPDQIPYNISRKEALLALQCVKNYDPNLEMESEE